MHRLDSKLKAMDMNADENAEAIAKREEALAPTYLGVAHEFADLHDRAGRMKAKGVIRDVLSWPRSRAYLAKRLKRRLAEDALRGRASAASPRTRYHQNSGRSPGAPTTTTRPS